MSKINKILVAEASITTEFQSKLKTMLDKAIRENGIDKEQVREAMRPDLTVLVRKVTRAYLKLGLDWLK